MTASAKYLVNKMLISTPWCRLPQLPGATLQPQRYSSFRSSKPVQDLQEYPDVDVAHNPPEWKYVKLLLPPDLVPKPVFVKPDYPSGWRPSTASDQKHAYFVARTMNHMIPVYLHTRFREQRRITVVRRIHGDIWALERDLRDVVEKSRNGKLCASRVNELSGQIHFHGDYVDVIREYLKQQGY